MQITHDEPSEASWLSELRKILAENRISQTEFAEELGIRRETVSRWFKGEEPPNPDRATIDRILTFCRKLDPTVSYERIFGPRAARALAAVPSVPAWRKR